MLKLDGGAWLNASVAVSPTDKELVLAATPFDMAAFWRQRSTAAAGAVVTATAYAWGPIPMMSAYDIAIDLPVLGWNRTLQQPARPSHRHKSADDGIGSPGDSGDDDDGGWVQARAIPSARFPGGPTAEGCLGLLQPPSTSSCSFFWEVLCRKRQLLKAALQNVAFQSSRRIKTVVKIGRAVPCASMHSLRATATRPIILTTTR